MKVAGEILVRVGALLAVTVACYLIGFSDYVGVGSVALNIVLCISTLVSSRTDVFVPMSRLQSFATICFGFAFIAFAIWAASSGFNQTSNEWFKHSATRPWLAGIVWFAYAFALLFSYRQHLVGEHRQSAPNYSLKRTAENRRGVD